jgi:hypothetical protein
MNNPFFEALLNSPEFHEELRKMRQWVQDQLFRPGGVVPRSEGDRIAWNLPSLTPEYSAIRSTLNISGQDSQTQA